MLRKATAACLGILLVLLRGEEGAAQIYTFREVVVPDTFSLHVLHTFYVFSLDEAPGREHGPPFVKFSGLEATPTITGGSSAALAQYKSLQVSIVRYQDFRILIKPGMFCSRPIDVPAYASQVNQLMLSNAAHQAYEDLNFYTNVVRFSEAQNSSDVKSSIKNSGAYILIVSNCGNISNATVSGRVIVKNAYGFLPGDEYYKMPFYGVLLLVYTFCAVIWMGFSIRRWKDMFNMQHSVSAVIFLGLLEAFLWYILYNEWNTSGQHPDHLFAMAIFTTIVKSITSYMLALVASLGWGTTKPHLDQDVINKVIIITLAYVVFDLVRQAALSMRQTHSLSTAFTMLCLAPNALLNGVIFGWIFTALSDLMEVLKERHQFEKLLLLWRLWRVLLTAMCFAALSLGGSVFAMTQDVQSRWKQQWIHSDGTSHAPFVFVLVCIMCLFLPGETSQRYAYYEQADGSGGDADQPKHPAAVWDDDDVVEEEQGDTFWSATRDQQKAEVIGAPAPLE